MNCLMHPLKETMPLAGVKTNAKRGTGLDTETCVVSDELNNSVYVYNIDSFPLVNNSHNGDLHLPGTADVTDGQADAATHDRNVDCQHETVLALTVFFVI